MALQAGEILLWKQPNAYVGPDRMTDFLRLQFGYV